MTELKACKVCNISRQKWYGLAATSLAELKVKGVKALGFSPNAPVSVVLDDDGTVIEDEDYFLCLPANTKFMLLNIVETWTPAFQGKRQSNRPSVHLEVFEDCVDGAESWHGVAEHLRQNLSNIILMSEADLQSLIDVPCSQLATVLGFSEQKTHMLQDTLQTFIDRREEERQSKDLLQLYLKAVKQESSQEPQEQSVKLDETDGVQVETTAGFSPRTLTVLKDKTHPETRLSNDELQMVVKHGVEVMMAVLAWDRERTAMLVQDCEAKLSNRLERIQAMQFLHVQNQSPFTISQPRCKQQP